MYDTIRHLNKNGINPRQFYGLDNQTQWKLTTEHCYEVDSPGSGFKISGTSLGCTISHWILWKALKWAPEQGFYSIMESDIRLRDGWQDVLNQCMADIPDDWDMIYPGNCCVKDATLVKGNLYKARPLCTHWYIVRRKALATLIKTNALAWAPIDLQIYFRSQPKLNTYAILPRIADQHKTDFPD